MSVRPQQRPSAPPVVSQPRRPWTPRKITVLVVGLVVLLAIGVIGWLLLSPLFFHNTANDTNPLAGSTTVTAPSAPGVASTSAPTGPLTLATGKFIDKANSGAGLANDHGSGNVTIGKTADGQYVIHFDHLNVTNGPDLHVYLSTPTNPTTGDQVMNGGVDLGLLKATEGSVTVSISANVASHLMQYHSVVIYCKSFAVVFTEAPLQFA